MQIERLLVRPKDTLLNAIEAMDRAHTGLALVVDDEGRLIGAVVDGDVRRALINGLDLHQPVETVMTRDPICVPARATDSEIVQLLQSPAYAKRTPVYIPAVDDAGRPVKLYTSSELLSRGGLSPGAGKPASRTDNILVVGGAGYVGSVLVRHLLTSGCHVTVLDKLLYGDASLRDLAGHPQFEFVPGDTRHIDDLVPALRKANAVVHLAELVGDPLCGRDPQTTFEINYLATSSIARICSYLQINRFVYLSSCSVYGASENPDTILDEHSYLAPVSLYARMKINSERVILSSANGNFSPCILRLGTVFGLSHRPRFDLVVNTLTARAVQDGEIEIFGGDQWRPHVHVADVARAIQLALESPIERVKNQAFNIVGENQRIDDVGRMVTEVIPGINVVQKGTVVDKRNYRVSGDKAEEILGFKPTRSIRDGIQEIAEALESGRIQDYKDKRYYNNLLVFEGEIFDS